MLIIVGRGPGKAQCAPGRTRLGCRICRTIKPGKVVSKTVGLDGITPVLEAMGRYDTVGVVAIDLKIEGRYGQRNSGFERFAHRRRRDR